MAKKQHWKKAVRAEVAAALQGQQLSSSESKTPEASTTGEIPKTSPTGSAALDTSSFKEVRLVLIVAGILLVLLVAAAWTNQQTQWLDNLAAMVTDSLSDDAAPLAPTSTTDATTPPAVPTE